MTMTSRKQLEQRLDALRAWEYAIKEKAFPTASDAAQLASISKQADFFGQCLIKLIGEKRAM